MLTIKENHFKNMRMSVSSMLNFSHSIVHTLRFLFACSVTTAASIIWIRDHFTGTTITTQTLL